MAVTRLDKFFTQLNAGWKSEYAWLGNEPCLQTPWIYCFLGQPYKTQEIINRTVTTLYSHSDTGYPGNDDLGELSSWYVFAALGMYPELPGSDILVFTTPLFPKAVLHLESGDVTITANGENYSLPYVQSMSLNGASWDQPWVRFKNIRHGASIDYKLGATANIAWGSRIADAPHPIPGRPEHLPARCIPVFDHADSGIPLPAAGCFSKRHSGRASNRLK